ncbi:zinc finger protein 384 isoform X3 [Physeter macrocephalus]|uniref:Zinc finger protein 384 isoform X3 n=1 Tax=Physeter macrocephalus TaxID=9755 RepID=A0A9W2WQH0_PHYMC|nr:zinc finger protein 384 isoform X3 [Physeter catodon]|eukprot:XP_028346774.1 zinc finger protein 384 isoform X3 [Physeter catodon]
MCRMEESHFNSNPYFWPSIPTVSGQIENTMFINKMKDQLLPEKGCGLAPPHYPTLLTVPASVSLPSGISMDTESKSDQLTPHSQASVTQNITVVPVPSTGLMTAGPGLVITSPSGSLVTTASSAQTFPISAPMIVSALPPGSQALQVVPDLSKKVASTLTEEGGGGGGGGGTVAAKPPRGRKKKRMLESGLPEMNDPYVLSPEDDDDHQKDGKTYRSEGNCGTGNGQSLGLMDSVPGSTTNLLCDPGQVLSPSLGLSFLICKMGRILFMPPSCWEYISNEI